MTLLKLASSNHGLFRVMGIVLILLANHNTTATPLQKRLRDLKIESSSQEYTFKIPPYPQVATKSAKLQLDPEAQDVKDFWSVFMEREIAGSYEGLLTAKPTKPPVITVPPSIVPTSNPTLEPRPAEIPSIAHGTPTFDNALLLQPSMTLTKPPSSPPTREPTAGPTITVDETTTAPTSSEPSSPGSFIEPSTFQPSIRTSSKPTSIPTGSPTRMAPNDASAIATEPPTEATSPMSTPTEKATPFPTQELDSEINGVNRPPSQTETGTPTKDPMTQPVSEPTFLVTVINAKPTTLNPTLLPTIEPATVEPSQFPTRLSADTSPASLPTAALISSSEPTGKSSRPTPSTQATSEPAISVTTTSEPTNSPMITPTTASMDGGQPSETGPTSGPFQAGGLPLNEISQGPLEASGDVPSGVPMAPPSLGSTRCEVATELTCTTLDGRDCSELRGEQFIQCRCEDDCPRGLVYRYTAAPCDPKSVPRNCADFEVNDAVVEVVITNLNEEVTFFEGRIQIGDDIVLESQGGCLPDSFQVNVVSPITGDISQIVTLDSFCDVGGPTLLDDYGAFEFAGYTCRDGIQHHCYIAVEYESNTAWSGAANQALSSWNFVLNGLENPGGTTFLPLSAQDQFYSTIIPQEVYLCVDGDYIASVSASAVGDEDGKKCGDRSHLTFNITVGSPFPTLSPGGTPSVMSALPASGYPSDDRSEVPTAKPTVETSEISSLQPADGANQVPSIVPSIGPMSSVTPTGLQFGPFPPYQPTIVDITGAVTGSGAPTATDSEVTSNSPTALPSLPATYPATKRPAGQTWPTSAGIIDDTEIPSTMESSRAPISGQSEVPGITLQPTFEGLTGSASGPFVVTVSPPSAPFSPAPTTLPSAVPSLMPAHASARPVGGSVFIPIENMPTNKSPAVGIASFNPMDSPSAFLDIPPFELSGPMPSGHPSDVLSVTPSHSIIIGQSDHPSAIPSLTHSIVPSDTCVIETAIECTTNRGIPCSEIVPIEPSCSSNGSITSVRFRLDFAPCEDSYYSQKGFTCVDLGPFPAAGQSARVACRDSDANVLFSNLVRGEGMFVLSADTSAGLLAYISCSITTDGGTDIQKVAFDLSGGDQLYLQNSFGSLSLEACDELDCHLNVSYSYSVENAGYAEVSVNSLARTRGGNTQVLMPILGPSLIAPGSTVVASESETINICSNQLYSTTINVEAVPPTGSTCVASASFQFETSFDTSGTITSQAPGTVPSLASSDIPSEIPSQAPSNTPSLATSNFPSQSPSLLPSGGPTTVPSTSPTEQCEFDLETTCIPPPGASSCDITPPPAVQCSGRPFEIGFLFTGGDCSQSYNAQGDEMFFCSDLNGGPPRSTNESAFIVVMDTEGKTIYHRDWVQVGTYFVVSDDGNSFGANQQITIYNSSNTDSSDNILQAIQYHSSCSNDLFLKDRFGALQLVQWVNDIQGVVTCFANQTFDLDITVPLDVQGGPATLTNLMIASNVEPFFFNMTDKVAGSVLEPGETFSTSISVPLDLTTRKVYNFAISVQAATSTGQICNANNLQSFTAGSPLPPTYPTSSPSTAPTSTNQPTTDPETTPCDLEADISCRTSTGRTCRSIAFPARVCDSDEDPTLLQFEYTGRSCTVSASTDFNSRCREATLGLNLTQEQVYIIVEGPRINSLLYNGIVAQGETFSLTSSLGRDITIMVMELDAATGLPTPTELQRINRLDTSCGGEPGKDLTLGQDYGAVRLVGFETQEQGLVSTVETITVTYAIRNDGVFPALLLSTFSQSPFVNGSRQLLSEAQTILDGEELSFTETASLNVENAAQAGTLFQFGLFLTGDGAASGLPCFDQADYFFRVDDAYTNWDDDVAVPTTHKAKKGRAKKGQGKGMRPPVPGVRG